MEDVSQPLVDARGTPVVIGSRVRIIGVPDFSTTTPHSVRQERERVFRHIRGRCKTIDDIDKHGYVGFTFKIRAGRDAGIHCIWIEPNLLLVQTPHA